MADNTEEEEFTDFSVPLNLAPYDVLYNIMCYISGIKPLAHFMRCAQRLYEVGSEQDSIWRYQLHAFYPGCHVDENSTLFVGHWYALRAFVTSSKTNALAALINKMHGETNGGDWQHALTANNADLLLNASEINFSRGVCMGAVASKLFCVTVKPHGNCWMLDTLDLSGQRIRAEGLEYLAVACEAQNLPFLKNLALRSNKLGVGDGKRSGAALKRIADCRKDNNNNSSSSLASLDLTDNGIGGTVDAIREFFCNGTTRLPARMWLDENYLGTLGAAMVLEWYAAQMTGDHVPTTVSFRNTGIGFDHTTAAAGGDAGRSKLELCARLVAAVMSVFGPKFHDTAQQMAAGRMEQREKREAKARSARNLGANVTTLMDQYSSAKKNRQQQQQERDRLHTASVSALLDLSNRQNCPLAPLKNAFPVALSKYVREEKEAAAAALRSAFDNNNSKFGESVSRMVGSQGLTRLTVVWPTFDGADPSSCCIQ